MALRARLVAVARRRPEMVTALAMTAVMTIAAAVWLLRYRRGVVVDVDEAAYLGGVFDDTTALERDGVAGLWHTWTAHADYAPLVPMSAVPFQLLLGRHILAAYGALDVWLGVLLVAAASIARRLAGPRWAVVAVIVTGCLPGVVDATTTFHFALPAAALLTATTAALLASDRLRSTRWALAAGALAGLTLLARSMMVALVPGALLAGCLLVAASPARARSARNLAMAAGVAVALAATWYGPNVGTIWTYLTSYGYGDASADYGTGHAPWDPAWWSSRALGAVREDVGVPLAIGLAAGLGVALARWWRHRPRGGTTERRRWSEEAIVGAACAAVVVEGYLALSSTANRGSGFELPLLPVTACLAVAGLARMRRAVVRRAAVGLLAGASALVLVAKSGAVPALVAERDVSLPLAGTVPIVDGRGDIQRYLASRGSGEAGSLDAAPDDHLWQTAAADLEARLDAWARARGRLAVVCFATRDPFVSTNHVQLAARYWWDAPPPPVAQLTPRRGGDSEANYLEKLSAPEEGQPNLLVTGDPSPRDFVPQVTQQLAVDAARQLGFRPAFAAVLPDGRHLQVWWLERGPVAP